MSGARRRHHTTPARPGIGFAVRIIAGTRKGHTIRAPTGSTPGRRPTGCENVFNIV
jgi:hypothetical protein